MTPDEPTRPAQVDRSLVTATSELSRHHPHLADRVGAALGGLRPRLARAHTHSHRADDRAWAEYRTALDHGLGELDAELARAAEQPADAAAPAVDDLLYVRATALELDGWVLHTDVAGGHAGAATVRELAAAAERELDGYRDAPAGAGATRRAGVERAMDDLRRSARAGSVS